MEIATIFESKSTKKGEGWTYSDLYAKLDSFIEDFCKQRNIKFNKEDGKFISIIYDGIPIKYRIYHSYKFGRYFLSFFPVNRWKFPTQPKNTELVLSIKSAIDFFNLLPDEINLGLLFKKSHSIGNINISSWTFGTNPDIGKSKLSEIERFPQYNSIGKELLKHNLKSINKTPVFFIGGSQEEKRRFHLIKEAILPLFSEQEVIYEDTENVTEILTSNFNNKNIFVFLFGKNEKIDEFYKRYKKYFIEKGIPSQFVSSANALGENILTFGIANLIIEILKKTGKDSIFLDNQCSSDIDCLLYLSDISETEKEKFFGISIDIPGEGTTEELVEIYKDINYKKSLKQKGEVTKEGDRIYFEEEDLNKLAERITKLSSHLKGKNIYIFVSKLWAYKDVELICKLLDKEKINVKKFVYISDKANRFVFSSLLESSEIYNHPYIIWDSQSASILTNSKLQFYGSIFPIYVEVLRPDSNGMNEEDLKIILWLVKKRIYRIANFFKLRTPELLYFFKQFNKLPLAEVETLRISLGFLI